MYRRSLFRRRSVLKTLHCPNRKKGVHTSVKNTLQQECTQIQIMKCYCALYKVYYGHMHRSSVHSEPQHTSVSIVHTNSVLLLVKYKTVHLPRCTLINVIQYCNFEKSFTTSCTVVMCTGTAYTNAFFTRAYWETNNTSATITLVYPSVMHLDPQRLATLDCYSPCMCLALRPSLSLAQQHLVYKWK